jgi:hypothetical protein
MHEAVEASYVNGIPRHHLNYAREETFDPSNCNQSSVFIVEHAKFKTMSPQSIQEIFCHRHILVLNVASNAGGEFSFYALSQLGCVDKVRQMQSMYYNCCCVFPPFQ